MATREQIVRWRLRSCGNAITEPADALARSKTADGKTALTTSLTAHLKTLNTQLEAHEKLNCLAVVGSTWSPENGFVTPTFKVKRNRVEDAYDQQYEAWLAQRKPVVWVAG